MKKLTIVLFALLPVIAYAQVNSSDTDVEIVEYEFEEEITDDNSEKEVFEIFDVSEMASFPGGDAGLQRFIADSITYPKEALDSNAQGSVNVMFVVNTDGTVSDMVLLGTKKGYGLEEEAMRVIQATSGMWSPAMQRDKAVRMRFRIPIKFQVF